MKIGLDYHGVINSHLEFFTLLTDYFIKNGHEVHIITGMRKKDFNIDIKYTHFYSITDYLLKNKYAYKLDSNNRPIFDKITWDSSKGKYCKENHIDIMFDDSDIYHKYFDTIYFRLQNKTK